MFTFPSLLWFLPVAVVVVLVHWLNLFRVRRVAWSGMAFLLSAHRVHRTRLRWEEFLLVMLRTVAVLLLVLAFAGPILSHRSGTTNNITEHFIILDDSLSMSEGGTDLGRAVSSMIPTSETVTLVCTSQPQTAVDINTLDTLQCSDAAVSPLDAVTQLRWAWEDRIGRNSVVTLISDFRKVDFGSVDFNVGNDAGWETLRDWRERGTLVQFLDVHNDVEMPNRRIKSVSLVAGVHAASVEMALDVTVSQSGRRDSTTTATLATSIDSVQQPPVDIPPLRVGESVTLRVPIRVQHNNNPQHRVALELRATDDSVRGDNHASLVLTVSDELRVLIITNSDRDNSAAAQCLRLALAPHSIDAGIRVQTEPWTFLNTPSLLDQFAVVIILGESVLQLDTTATTNTIKSLEDFVSRGGGVVFFVDDATNAESVNCLFYRDSSGLLPIALASRATLPPDPLGTVPDVRFSPHPIFRLFDGNNDPLASAITVDKYFAIQQQTTTPQQFTILAQLRAVRGVPSPLVVEGKYGDGRTLAWLTTADAAWNSWSRQPSFVVVMREMVAYLANPPSPENTPLASIRVGDAVIISEDATKYRRTGTLSHEVSETTLPFTFGEACVLPRAGFWTATLTSHDGTPTTKTFGANIDPRESEMQLADRNVLVSRVRDAGFAWVTSITGDASLVATLQRYPLSDFLLALVVLALIGEMLLSRRIAPPAA